MTSATTEDDMRQLLARGLLGLLRLPPALEQAFRAQARERCAKFLRYSVFGLLGIYLLVVVPIALGSHDAPLQDWLRLAVAPIGVVLAILVAASRIPRMERHVESLLGACLMICLTGTTYCALLLGEQYFGRMAAYETIYILAIAFSILRLPAKSALLWSLAAFVLALLAILQQQRVPVWLDLLLYFFVPLLICAVIGLMMEVAERRSFIKMSLLAQNEVAGVPAGMTDAASGSQQLHEYRMLASGLQEADELHALTLRFLVTQTDALVGASYRITTDGLVLCSAWGGSAEMWRTPAAVEQTASLLTPALSGRRAIQLTHLPTGHLRIRGASAEVSPEVVLVVPVLVDVDTHVVIELGRLSAFSLEQCRLAESVADIFAQLLAMRGHEN
ncbi:MAG: hypothetical protein Q8J78_15405 [Moraxellaceae bacterium]|nr:hypothetical protein [Moraxellaceae bacterium]